MALTGQQYEINAGGASATIVEVGAGLRRFAVDGVEVTAGYGEHELPPRGCGSTLVPWPNRLRGGHFDFDGASYQVPLSEPATGNANHGLARWARWSPVRHDADAVTLVCAIVPQTGWPFEVRVAVTYRVSSSGLIVQVAASNTGGRSAPFGCGFHPYLSTHGHPLDEVMVTVPASTHLVVDAKQIPVRDEPVAGDFDLRAGRRLGDLRLDDAFTDLVRTDGRAVVQVATPSGGAELWMDESFAWTQVFTPDDLAHGVPGVAVEPMSCPADAFNSGAGLVTLEPGADWSGTWGIRPIEVSA